MSTARFKVQEMHLVRLDPSGVFAHEQVPAEEIVFNQDNIRSSHCRIPYDEIEDPTLIAKWIMFRWQIELKLIHNEVQYIFRICAKPKELQDLPLPVALSVQYNYTMNILGYYASASMLGVIGYLGYVLCQVAYESLRANF